MKIIATDYDGTLNQGGIPDVVKNSVRDFRKCGNIFTIISGRDIGSLVHTLEKEHFMGECDYLIANNGAVIADKDGKIVFDIRYSGENIKKLIDFVTEDGRYAWAVQGYKNTLIVKSTEGRNADLFKDMSAVDDITYLNQVSTVCKTTQASYELTERINTQFKNEFIAYANGDCIDILPSGVSKATGVQKLLEIVGGKSENVRTAGDNLNDLAMLEAYESYALGSAVEKVKETANHRGTTIKDLIDRENGEYDVTKIKGKTYIWLGSSVTYGAASDGVSIADFMDRFYQCKGIKEAVSGTTLVDNGENSYISRMKKIDKNIKVDHFICQLSTNDATRKMPLGNIGLSKDIDSFDTKTVAGAIEYIIAYAKETWNCPVSFYTNTRYDSEEYERMTQVLHSIADKWGIGIIDLWNNEEMSSVSEDNYKKFMADKIHPTKYGYYMWWLPEFVKYLGK